MEIHILQTLGAYKRHANYILTPWLIHQARSRLQDIYLLVLLKDLHRLLARCIWGDGMKLWVQHEVNIVQFLVVSAAA